METQGRPRPLLQREVLSASSRRTLALGRELGRRLAPGDFVGLIGDLGAGKTQLVRGVAEGAEVPKHTVTSPTFAILAPYQGRILLYHADFYRLANLRELEGTGFVDLLGEEAAFLVEWLDRIPEAAPPDLLQVTLSVVDVDRRRLTARAFGERSAALLEAWLTG